MIFPVGERLEPAPRVARQPGHELAVGAREGVVIDERPRGPAREPRPDIGSRGLLAAERRLPRLLLDGDDDVAGAGLDHAAHDLLAELAGLVPRKPGQEVADRCPETEARRNTQSGGEYEGRDGSHWHAESSRTACPGKAKTPVSRAGSGRCSRPGASGGTSGDSPRPSRTPRPGRSRSRSGRPTSPSAGRAP